MLLINKRVLLKQGSLIRIVGTHCKYDPTVYQYTVDMLWPGNKWRRIRVSKMHDDCLIMMLCIKKLSEESQQYFNAMFLVKECQEKYGKEKIIYA